MLWMMVRCCLTGFRALFCVLNAPRYWFPFLGLRMGTVPMYSIILRDLEVEFIATEFRLASVEEWLDGRRSYRVLLWTGALADQNGPGSSSPHESPAEAVHSVCRCVNTADIVTTKCCINWRSCQHRSGREVGAAAVNTKRLARS
jgi:hypothetical protein